MLAEEERLVPLLLLALPLALALALALLVPPLLALLLLWMMGLLGSLGLGIHLA